MDGCCYSSNIALGLSSTRKFSVWRTVTLWTQSCAFGCIPVSDCCITAIVALAYGWCQLVKMLTGRHQRHVPLYSAFQNNFKDKSVPENGHLTAPP